MAWRCGQPLAMGSRAVEELRRRGAVASRAELVAATSPEAVDWAARSGRLERVLPRTYVEPAQVADWLTRCRAAVAYAGPDAVVSHLSALRVWELPAPEQRVVDVTVGHARRPRTVPETAVAVAVHRSRRPGAAWARSGVPVVTLERAVVQSWPLLRHDAQRAPAVVAVRRRLTTPARLRRELADHPRLPGRRDLAALVSLLELGCHSELELWGHQEVFTGPRFATWQRQVPLTTARGRVHLDLYDRAAQLAVELDGRTYHDSPRDRERDLARDALVAEVGILTIRFPHRRLVQDPQGCREQAWRVREVRCRQLGPRATGDAQLC